LLRQHRQEYRLALHVGRQAFERSLSVLFLKMTHIIEPAELERRRKATRRRVRKELESRGKTDKGKSQQQQKNSSKNSKLTSLDGRINITNGNASNSTKRNTVERKGRSMSPKNTTAFSNSNQAVKTKKVKRLISSSSPPTEIDSNTSSSSSLEPLASEESSPTAAPTPSAPLFISLDDIKDAVVDISRYHSGLVVVANVGAWYNSREKFRKELPVFITKL